MTPDILRKLEAELNAGITTEAQVVYLLVGIRKLLERNKMEDKPDEPEDNYTELKFHCDWALHASMNRTRAKTILKQFDAAYALLRGTVKLDTLPEPLKCEIERISKMLSFEEEFSKILATHGLPLLTQHRPDGWAHFLYLYGKVIEDIPLVVSVPTTKHGPKHISNVTVNCETAREKIMHAGGEEILFKITWTIQGEDGQSGSIFVINSFLAQSQ